MSTAACKPRKRDAAERLSAYVSFMDGVDPVSDEGFERRIGFFLERAGREVSSEEIAKHVLLPREEAEATAQRLVDAGTVSALESGWYIHRGVFDRILNGIAVRFEKAAAQDGFIGMHVSGLTAGDGVSQRVLKAAIDCLEAQGVIRRRGARIVYAQADSDLGVNDHRAAEQIAGIFRDSGFRSPRPDEIPGMTGISETASMRLIEYLCDRGDIVRLSKTVILSRDAFHEAQNNVIGIIKREGVLDSADFKHHIGSSRKYALAILDYLDAMRVTVRSGNDRVLSPGYERNLPV
jgi:selenocysteine-specific elongation factor